jgi:hypothetical protein
LKENPNKINCGRGLPPRGAEVGEKKGALALLASMVHAVLENANGGNAFDVLVLCVAFLER